MTSRAVRICKIKSKITYDDIINSIKSAGNFIVLWIFIVITIFILPINNILKFASIKFDVISRKCICSIAKPCQYIDSVDNNGIAFLKNSCIFMILCIYIIIILLMSCINNILKFTSNIVDFAYIKCIYYFSKSIEYIDNNKLYNDSSRQIIYDRSNKEPYLIRYYLLFTDRVDFPFNVFIHKFMRGDDDEDPHDHPWGFFHIILSGGYWEEVPIDENGEPKFYKGFCKVWRRPGYWNIVNAEYTHRIELDDARPKPLTLFIPLRHKNYWGFWVKNNMNVWSKVNHDVYLKNKDKTSTNSIKID